jgi:hypothetical protein
MRNRWRRLLSDSRCAGKADSPCCLAGTLRCCQGKQAKRFGFPRWRPWLPPRWRRTAGTFMSKGSCHHANVAAFRLIGPLPCSAATVATSDEHSAVLLSGGALMTCGKGPQLGLGPGQEARPDFHRQVHVPLLLPQHCCKSTLSAPLPPSVPSSHNPGAALPPWKTRKCWPLPAAANIPWCSRSRAAQRTA